ncbi:MAG TPA: transcriptional repressor [Nitrospiria bacterium]|nr:transcriptional repressor [Nitrospiria bacterium]
MQSHDVTVLLSEKALKVTPQRVAVMEFLRGNTTHPSVDDVYQQVRKRFPSISRATIYNTVTTLVEAGLLQEILIQQEKTHVDWNVDRHHHFQCLKCGTVKDIRYDAVTAEQVSKHVVGHLVTGVKVVMEGVCESCR